jgi:multidrug efflux pump subunit AcrB
VGTTVFGARIASTVLKQFFIPVLYPVNEVARERMGAKMGR